MLGLLFLFKLERVISHRILLLVLQLCDLDQYRESQRKNFQRLIGEINN